MALALYRDLIGQRLRAEVQVGRAGPMDVDQAAEVLARLAISLFPAREGTVTLDDDETIVALARKGATADAQASRRMIEGAPVRSTGGCVSGSGVANRLRSQPAALGNIVNWYRAPSRIRR